MKIAVVEHHHRADSLEDARALGAACREAAEKGAEAVFLPYVVPVDDAGATEELFRLTDGLPGLRLIPRIASGVRSQVFAVTDQVPVIGPRLGKVALLHGDACVNDSVIERTSAANPAIIVLTPGAESELQAAAFLELAIGLSESAAPLVIVSETIGAEPGDPGHGGSAIVFLGDVMSESSGDEGEVLFAEVPEPLPVLSPREPLPELATLLQQRRANHEGVKLDVGYPADLS